MSCRRALNLVAYQFPLAPCLLEISTLIVSFAALLGHCLPKLIDFIGQVGSELGDLGINALVLIVKHIVGIRLDVPVLVHDLLHVFEPSNILADWSRYPFLREFHSFERFLAC